MIFRGEGSMESKNYETRHVYMAIGIVTALFSPIFLTFVPQTVAEIIHYKKGVWEVLIPDENFIAFGVGFSLIFFVCMILFIFDIQKYSILVSVILSLLSIGCFFIASQSHVSLSDEAISYTPFYSIKDYSYPWTEVEKIRRIDYKREERIEYEFNFIDGNHLVIQNNDYFSSIWRQLRKKVGEMNIEIEAVEK
jgi:hypothetical protein